MTLLIAWLIILMFQLSPPAYLAALAVWVAELLIRRHYRLKREQAHFAAFSKIRQEVNQLHAQIDTLAKERHAAPHPSQDLAS
jgi:cell division protein FtsB